MFDTAGRRRRRGNTGDRQEAISFAEQGDRKRLGVSHFHSLFLLPAFLENSWPGFSRHFGVFLDIAKIVCI